MGFHLFIGNSREFHNEIVGLMNEIIQIENSHATLNQHKGGQGKDFNIVLNKNQLGRCILCS